MTATQLLAAFRGTELPSAKKTIADNAAASRLQVALTWAVGGADSPPFPAPPRYRITLTSPSGIVFDTSAPVPGFTATADGATLQATLENPAGLMADPGRRNDIFFSSDER